MSADPRLLELKRYVDIAIEMYESGLIRKLDEDEILESDDKYPKDSILLGPFVITRNR